MEREAGGQYECLCSLGNLRILPSYLIMFLTSDTKPVGRQASGAFQILNDICLGVIQSQIFGIFLNLDTSSYEILLNSKEVFEQIYQIWNCNTSEAD